MELEPSHYRASLAPTKGAREARGSLTDWVTQLWVRFTGRHVSLSTHPWLAGPTGDVTGIGRDFFDTVAEREGLAVRRAGPGDARGLLANLGALAAPDFDPSAVHPNVAAFYQETSEYDLDAWAQWCGIFRPFGWLLALLFSRRLQQLNVPLSGLDTSRGVTSEVIQLIDPADGSIRYTGWVRQLLGSGDVLYAGSYSTAAVPGRVGLCVKVVFPLPNGNAIVLMRPEAHGNGSLSVVSAGRAFGNPGFYFTVRAKNGNVHARYLRSLKEGIRVYPASNGDVRADHSMTLWGLRFLQLHYRLRRISRPAHVEGAV